jgi:hypothetical protein
MVAIPAALLAALGIVDLVWPLFQKAFSTHAANERPPLAPGVRDASKLNVTFGVSLPQSKMLL